MSNRSNSIIGLAVRTIFGVVLPLLLLVNFSVSLGLTMIDVSGRDLSDTYFGLESLYNAITDFDVNVSQYISMLVNSIKVFLNISTLNLFNLIGSTDTGNFFNNFGVFFGFLFAGPFVLIIDIIVLLLNVFEILCSILLFVSRLIAGYYNLPLLDPYDIKNSLILFSNTAVTPLTLGV